jgi:SWI/SNF-related matrix-associated actin-dependent regulator 1 of chromatin subfamily A
MENWRKELELWAPDIQIVTYWGSQDERRHLRLQLVQDELDYDVILTTYNMVISSPEDRVLFKKMEFHYVVFDEAHMLKNMASQRYEQLMKIRCSRKLLLTGTPLQNNLVELMSLLIFVMPGMFAKKKEQLKKMFSLFPKQQDECERSNYEKDRIAHAKRIMKPFFLRRLKADVLTDLPAKVATVERVPMSTRQAELYFQLVADYKARAAKLAQGIKIAESGQSASGADSAIGMLMNLRKTANHPLLIRDQYDDHKLGVIARMLKTRDSGHKEAVESFIIEDLQTMSDFDIHKTCETYRCIEQFALGNHLLCDSGKFQLLDDLLPQIRGKGDRVLIFSQFTMLLDVLERYLKIRGHKYMRLDGQTPVQERQELIDKFNRDEQIFIFILSTRAGGLGINLTAANTVILHDLDFNPYNDKQAEDRCHRVGQTKEVRVIRFTSEDTIEEGIHQVALEKLKLEQDVTGENENDTKKKKDVARLLKTALGVELKEKLIGDVGKVYTEL